MHWTHILWNLEIVGYAIFQYTPLAAAEGRRVRH